MSLLRKLALALWVLLLAAPLHAASDLAISSLAQQGRHHELIAALAPRLDADGDLPSFQLMMLGGAYYETGQYPQATGIADRLEKRIMGGDASMFGADLSVYPAIIRGAVALDQGLLAEAIRHAEAANALLRENQPFHRSQLIQISGILGVAHALNGNAEAARRHLERIGAVNLFLSNLGPEKHTALARIQMALRDFPGALASITDARADVSPLLTAFYDPTFQNLPRFFIRSKALYETGRMDEAKRGYDELLLHPQISQFGTLYWIVLHDRARIAHAEDDLPLAIELLKRAIEVIEQRRSAIATEAGRIGFVGDKQAVYGLLVGALLRQERVEEAFDFVERAKSRALVDMLASKHDFAARDADPEEIRRVLAEIDALDRSVLEKQAAAAPEHENTRRRDIAAAKRQLAAKAPELATLVSVSTAPVAEIAPLLDPGTSLVEFFHAGDDLHAFVLGEGKMRAVRIAADGLEEEVLAWREAIGQAGGEGWRELAERLHTRLWQPLEAWLSGSRRIMLVPHGILHYLPFAALRVADGTLLLERHSLHLLPSASVLKFLPSRPPGTAASLLVLGNPDLGNPDLDLKFAAEEANAVSRLYPDARLLLRRDASETNFRSASRAFRRLHIASHGSFQADAPLASGLHLAKDADNDGILTVGELYSMDLNAELVTLSACETGLGKIMNGDDVVGLGRGFLYAGARSIVASLWSVDDHATAQLMQAFHRNLAAGDKIEALRQAQLDIRRQYPHPFFWAAFQFIGKN